MAECINLVDSDDDDDDQELVECIDLGGSQGDEQLSSCAATTAHACMATSSSSSSSSSSVAAIAAIDLAQREDERLAAAIQAEQDAHDVLEAEAALSAAREAEDLLWRQRRDMGEFVSRTCGKELRVEELLPNPHSAPGTALYARFVAAHGRASDKTIRLVFHGTPLSNVPAILQHGLDAGRRSGQAMGAGEYFGTDAETSLSYCRGQGMTMVIFAVLLDRSGLTAHQFTRLGERNGPPCPAPDPTPR
jgi:hypothetical protein